MLRFKNIQRTILLFAMLLSAGICFVSLLEAVKNEMGPPGSRAFYYFLDSNFYVFLFPCYEAIHITVCG